MHPPRRGILMLAALATVVFAGPARASTVLIQPSSQDSSLLQDAPNKTLGSGPTNSRFHVRTSTPLPRIRRGLVQFDLSAIPQFSTVNSATLELYQDSSPTGAAHTHGVHRVDEAWLQSTVKWNTQPAIQATPTDSNATVGPIRQFYSWSVATDVQGWLDDLSTNHGWMVKDAAETGSNDIIAYVSREESSVHDVAKRPKLTVDFTAPPCSTNADCAEDPDNPCTTNERCQAGHCAVDPVVCNDNDACTDDICIPDQGGCVFTVGECNDGFSCTIDSCDQGLGCVHTPVPAVCAHEGCQTGTCVADPDDETLDPVTGCMVTSVAADGTACTADGSPCTSDVCGAGECTHPDAPLGTGCPSDGNGCTDDVCDGAGGCGVNNSVPCSDGLFCNGPDTCSGGACTLHGTDPCSSGAECADACNEANDDCFDPPGGSCASDGNGCTDDVCDGAGGCGVPNSVGCDDGLFCNGPDTCSGGACTLHGTDPCASGTECADVCNEATDDCFDPLGNLCTPDGNGCTDDVCDGAGSCGVNNAAPCDDGLFCNGPDTCGGGGCTVHGVDPCAGGTECADACNEAADDCFDLSGATCATDDGNPCTDTLCDGAGTCGRTNTAPCDDGVFCNGPDTCSGGACDDHQGDPCAGGPECADTCNEGPQDCLDALGTPCTSDGNVCTDDVCDGAGDCGVDNSEPCDDGNTCTLADTCTGGACLGNSMTCGDGIVQSSCTEECDDAGAGPNCTAQCQFICDPTPDAACRLPVVSGKAFALLKNRTPDKKDALAWKWAKGAATTIADFGDPLTSTGYTLCIYDDSANPQPLLLATMPPGGTCVGKPCWKTTKTGFKYKDKGLDPDGVSIMLLRAGASSKAKVMLRGKGANLGMFTLPPTLPLTIQLKRSDSPGVCWQARYSTTIKNFPDQFKALAE